MYPSKDNTVVVATSDTRNQKPEAAIRVGYRITSGLMRAWAMSRIAVSAARSAPLQTYRTQVACRSLSTPRWQRKDITNHETSTAITARCWTSVV